MESNKIFLGRSSGRTDSVLSLAMANRHGLIAGATGTGKTATLQLLAESFSARGVPVFAPDIKGDLSGVAAPGQLSPKIEERIKKLSLSYSAQAAPAIFWDLAGKFGHPLRTTVSEMGPLIFTRLLDLNDTQEGVLGLAFKIADDNGLLLLDYEDLLALLSWVSDEKANLRDTYGSISDSTISTIRRKLLEFGERGGQALFGEPALNLADLMRRTHDGRGIVSIMDARSVVSDSRAYTSFLLWLLSELFEDLDEVGDIPAPRLVFFFDEAHLLFQDASPALVERIETVVRLVRSKGVGVYFITQNPLDIPERILGQLGNRVQHALRAFTPKDQKAVRVAAQTFRPNPALQTEKVITELGVGEALVSCLDENGSPAVVERVLIAPPASRLGPLTDAERQAVISSSPVRGLYEQRVNRESALEMLERRKNTLRVQVPEPERKQAKQHREQPSLVAKSVESAAKSFLRSFGSQLGREIFRGVLGSISRGRLYR